VQGGSERIIDALTAEQIKQLATITDDVIEAARSTLVIGIS